jgi:hypothetical protein
MPLPRNWQSRAKLGNLREVTHELVFFDNQEVIFVCLKQPQILKALHEHADAGPRRAHHLRQFFLRDLQLDEDAARVFLAECARQA